jgi:GWxTD domain-containing protein
MTPLETWVRTPGAEALGWTLLHFVWEGAAIALAMGAALGILSSSRARYAAAGAALAAMLVSFGLTFLELMPLGVETGIARRAPFLGPAPGNIAGPIEPHGIGVWSRFGELAPWIAVLWMGGVAIFGLRAMASWMAARRLRRTGVCRADQGWQRRLDELAGRLRVSKPVTLLESCLADAPVVIGCLRPAILIPIGLLTGLPAAQIESILIHELAHIRRHDYLMNLLQVFAESFLFFHPAVWWISGLIRAERENCCDDCVVAMTGAAHEYAVALVALEQNRSMSQKAALAATGGKLTNRIHRLLQQPQRPGAGFTPILAACFVVALAGVALGAYRSSTAMPRLAPQAGAPLRAMKRPMALLAQAQTTPQATPTPPVPSAYQKWLTEDVVYIISDQEREVFRRLGSDEERDKFIEQFWLRRDPTPGTPANEFKDEHYRRIAYANRRFRSLAGTQGWKTDRGRIYITFGPPDEIENHAAGSYERPAEQGGGRTSVFPFQQWRYRHVEEIGDNIIMEFVDRTQTGDYAMVMGPFEKEALAHVPGELGSVFASTGTATPVTVEVTPDHRALVSVPLDFDAREFAVAVRLQTAEGRLRNVVTARVKLCKDSPGVSGCLTQPMFRPENFAAIPLEPGSYVLSGTVGDTSGSAHRTFTVNFSVK